MASKSRSAQTRKAPATRSSPTAPASATASTSRAASSSTARAGGTRSATSASTATSASASQARGSRVPRTAGSRPPAQDATADAPAGTKLAPIWLQWATFVLAIAGLGVSAYLTYAHVSEKALLGCSESGLINCQKVTTSAQSYLFHIPVAVLGLAFYAFAVPIMSPWAWRMTRREIPVVRLAAITLGIGFVLYLLYAELFIIDSICLYCTSVHVITFLLFVLTMFAAAAWGLRPSRPETAS
jgi:uncharacterized membrane protein